jgi:hypothetical protein
MWFHNTIGAAGSGALESSISVDSTNIKLDTYIWDTDWEFVTIPTAWKSSAYTVIMQVSTWWDGTSPTSDAIGVATSSSATFASTYIYANYNRTSGGFEHSVFVTSGSNLSSHGAFGVRGPGLQANGAGRRTFQAFAATGVSSVELVGQSSQSNSLSINYPSTGLTLNRTPALFMAQVNNNDSRNARSFSIDTGDGFVKNYSSNIFSTGNYDNLRTTALIGNPAALATSQTITGTVVEVGGYRGSQVALNLIGE